MMAPVGLPPALRNCSLRVTCTWVCMENSLKLGSPFLAPMINGTPETMSLGFKLERSLGMLISRRWTVGDMKVETLVISSKPVMRMVLVFVKVEKIGRNTDGSPGGLV